jgi:hypothetical protein
MEYRVNGYCGVPILVIDGIGEPPEEAAPIRFVDWRIHLGRPAHALEAGVERAEKFFPQPHPSGFVPSVSGAYVLLSLWSED